MTTKTPISVPYFRPDITEEEIAAVAQTLRSGWLTTGPRVRKFETEFAAAVAGEHAVALNSCTAALHVGAEALGLKAGDAVLVPAMTFAATAEVLRYLGAFPILVDCDPETLNLDLAHAERQCQAYESGRLGHGIPSGGRVVGIVPVHVGGLMLDVPALREWAVRRELWILEDAAHAFPAAFRESASAPWIRCGQNTADVSCFSFYANKTITTGEGGMAVTARQDLAGRMRLMSLHGLSQDAWDRYSGGRSWDYRIVAPGYKYNLTDTAAALGLGQLARAEAMRVRREQIALRYLEALSGVPELDVPPVDPNRLHAWHLFPIRLRLERLNVDRDAFLQELRERGVAGSVHWRPLHLHPYYQENFGWTAAELPAASATWIRLISLPLFPSMREEEIEHVIRTVADLCTEHREVASASVGARR